jgi:hypothetical protein
VIPEPQHKELETLLLDAGFANGWAIKEGELIIWEHDEDPPKPLTRPS